MGASGPLLSDATRRDVGRGAVAERAALVPRSVRGGIENWQHPTFRVQVLGHGRHPDIQHDCPTDNYTFLNTAHAPESPTNLDFWERPS